MQKRTDAPASDRHASPEAFEQIIAGHLSSESTGSLIILVAVSGGADSVALLRALDRLRSSPPRRLHVAHFNHHWRESADEDEQFVRQLAQQLEIPITIGHARSSQQRSELAGRKARYAFLVETALAIGARLIATAHTADDQAETVLLRILRGTGIRGLAGIPAARCLHEAVTVIRPMLSASREQVHAYLTWLDQPWREDPTNADPRWARNRVRSVLLPTLEAEFGPSVRRSLLRLAAVARQHETLVGQCADRELERSIQSLGADAASLEWFGDQSQPMRREMLRSLWRRQGWPLGAMSRRQWVRLARLTTGEPAVLMLPGAVRAAWDGQRLKLERMQRSNG